MQALFWTPRFLVPSLVMAHVPLRFWLTAALDRAGSVDEMLEMIDAAEGTGPDAAAFMTGYLGNHPGSVSGKWIQRLLEALAGPGRPGLKPRAPARVRTRPHGKPMAAPEWDLGGGRPDLSLAVRAG